MEANLVMAFWEDSIKKKARFYFYLFYFFFSGTHNLGIDVEIPKKKRISKKQKISAFIVAAFQHCQVFLSTLPDMRPCS